MCGTNNNNIGQIHNKFTQSRHSYRHNYHQGFINQISVQKNKILTSSLIAGTIIIGLLVWSGLSKQQASAVSAEETTQESIATIPDTVQSSVEPGWIAVETTKYNLSYQVSPEKRAVGDAIEITAKLFDGDKPVEKADMIWDMAMMKKVDGDWKRTGTMKMLSSYLGDGIYKIQDMMFYEIGNLYEIVVNGEKIAETTIMPTL